MTKEIQDEIDNCAVCKQKKMRQLKRQQSQIVLNKKVDTFEMCDDCCDKVDTMNTCKLTWKHAKKVLSKRCQASLPGFVLGLKCVDKTKVIAECGYYDRQNEFVKTKLNVKFSWVGMRSLSCGYVGIRRQICAFERNIEILHVKC